MNRLLCMNRCYFNVIKHNVSQSSMIFGSVKVIPNVYIVRGLSNEKKKIRSTLNYMIALGVMTVGLSYAAVPLYRIFCQAYSYGGTTGQAEAAEAVSNMKTVKERPIKVRFNADVASSMQWNFKPQQGDITVTAILRGFHSTYAMAMGMGNGTNEYSDAQAFLTPAADLVYDSANKVWPTEGRGPLPPAAPPRLRRREDTHLAAAYQHTSEVD